MSVITELGRISGFQYDQEDGLLQFPSPSAKTQLRDGMFKRGSNLCPSSNHTPKDCPHIQKTIFYSHAHFLVTAIHILPVNEPHSRAVFVSLRDSTVLLCNECSRAPALRVAFFDSFSGFFGSQLGLGCSCVFSSSSLTLSSDEWASRVVFSP